jgi:multiple sugar transport system substrate-binding protein
MSQSQLTVAVTAGGMYDRLYERLPEFERTSGIRVTIRFRGTHPELNAHLRETAADGYDLVSTHSKYAPSQQAYLAPIEGFDTSDFFPALLDLAKIGGALYGVPRNIDLRLLHYRTDLMDSAPSTWDSLAAEATRLTRAPEHYGFVFTGMESGLFGTFFELAESAGAKIFPPSLAADVANDAGLWALALLRDLYQSGAAPPEVVNWHYDEVHCAFRSGHAAMVSDWPGYYGSYCEESSPVYGRFRVARMPAGPSGRVCCYAGSHTFALTRTGAAKAEARELLAFLTAPEQQALEASHGSVPVRRSVMAQQRNSGDSSARARLDLLNASIENDLIIPPRLSYYPEIENILWRTVRSAIIGEIEVSAALAQMEQRIEGCVSNAAGE